MNLIHVVILVAWSNQHEGLFICYFVRHESKVEIIVTTGDGLTFSLKRSFRSSLAMGRKPNQRVLEFFDRGARLVDNSNRYEHTCKACGELFPKGRIETLIAHIERRCPSIRRPNGVHISPPANHSYHPDTGANGTSGNAFEHLNGTIPGAKELVLPRNSRTSLSGLEALVEASTQLEHPPETNPIRPSQDQSIDPSLEQPSSRFPNSMADASLRENGRILRFYVQRSCH